MNALKSIPRFAVFVVFTITIFILDIFLHNYLVIWALYFYPLYRVAGVGSERQLKILTVLSSVFVVLCYLLFLQSGKNDIHLWNRLFGLTLLLIFAFIMLKKVKTLGALEEARGEYSALFNTKSNAIGHFDIITDASGKPVNIRYVKINAAYKVLMSLPEEEVVEGKLLTEVFPGIENAPQDYIGRYGKIGVEGGELFLEDYFAPHDIWVSAYVFSPQKYKIIVILNDITERKRIEEKLNELNNQLIIQNKELKQFAYTASHDLQEPIRMIKSYAALIDLKYHDVLNDSTREYLGFISEGAARMQQLVDGLLSYSLINVKQSSFEHVNCNDLVNGVLNDLELAIKESDAEVVVNGLPVIYADRVQIRQVFQNLIQNSLKFRGKRRTVIVVSCERIDSMWRFSVKDNGIGIEDVYLERIFMIFQRLHIRDEYPGTGIGLSIVKKIVERHGGVVFVESEPGKGSVFYFTIPVMKS